jgi:TetR/AcrR family transcriptional repressor of nem operon
MGRVSDARERLVLAAIELIWARSYGLVSVDAICERADVRKGSFYHFFKSKDQLVVAALDAHWQGRRPAFDEIFSSSVPPLERLRRYFDLIYDRQMELRRATGRILGCLHASVGSDCIRNSAEISAKVHEILAIYKSYLATALRDAHAAGMLSAPDPASKAQTLFAYVEGVLGQARIHDDPGLIAELRTGGWLLLGVAAPGAAAQPPARAASRNLTR